MTEEEYRQLIAQQLKGGGLLSPPRSPGGLMAAFGRAANPQGLMARSAAGSGEPIRESPHIPLFGEILGIPTLKDANRNFELARALKRPGVNPKAAQSETQQGRDIVASIFQGFGTDAGPGMMGAIKSAKSHPTLSPAHPVTIEVGGERITFPDKPHADLYDYGHRLFYKGIQDTKKRDDLWNTFKNWVEDQGQPRLISRVGKSGNLEKYMTKRNMDLPSFSEPKHIDDLAIDYVNPDVFDPRQPDSVIDPELAVDWIKNLLRQLAP